MMVTLDSWECPTGVNLGHTASTIGPAHFRCPDGHVFVCLHVWSIGCQKVVGNACRSLHKLKT